MISVRKSNIKLQKIIAIKQGLAIAVSTDLLFSASTFLTPIIWSYQYDSCCVLLLFFAEHVLVLNCAVIDRDRAKVILDDMIKDIKSVGRNQK